MAEAGIAENPSQTQNLSKWLIKDLTDLKPEAREVFEKYSKIPPENVITHVTQIRDKAFKIHPYPCLGTWNFLDLSIRRSPEYDEILRRIKDGDKYLDIGCCVGQDIRKLVYDGAPSENLYGSDLKQDFLDIGYDLFLDKDKLRATFIAADVFDRESGLKQLDGSIDIVHAASFFHLFDYEQQVQVAKCIVALMKPKTGGLIVGQQVGNVNAGERKRDTDQTRSRFSHDDKSFAKMWEQVGNETGTKWEVDARLLPVEVARNYTGSNHYAEKDIPEGTRWMTFTIRSV